MKPVKETWLSVRMHSIMTRLRDVDPVHGYPPEVMQAVMIGFVKNFYRRLLDPKMTTVQFTKPKNDVFAAIKRRITCAYLGNRGIQLLEQESTFKASHWAHYLLVVPFAIKDFLPKHSFGMMSLLATVISLLFFTTTVEDVRKDW